MSTKAKKTPASPRIIALKQQLEAGNVAALDAFWREVAAEGTPLIEPIEGDDRHALVTFLWRADEGIEHVVLYSELLRGSWWNNWADAILTRLPGTNLHYRTYHVRIDLRFVYWLSPDHPLTHITDVPDWDEYLKNCQLDPFNLHQYVSDNDRVWSFVEMPNAPPQPWAESDSGVPAGQVELFQMHSDVLDNDRRVWVYTPSGYRLDGEPYSLLVLFDGDNYTHWIPAPTILDNLIAAERIEPVVAVLLDSPDRSVELRYYDPFVDFLIKELVPWVRSEYHVTTDPAKAVVGGMSLGGLTAAFVALRHPEVFGNVLSQSGSFSYGIDGPGSYGIEIGPEEEWLTRQYATCDRLPLRFYLEAGLLENYRDQPQITLLRANRHLRDVLQARGYWVHYTEFSGGHQYFNWRGTLSDGLIALLGTSRKEKAAQTLS